ncbi:MAG: helix-turn-helix transcriptional regulator, partial [Solirubrobacteraceae bacterium]
MRASRLLSILLLLQFRGRLSARELADRVEASVRTIHRDIEQLSAAGVPVRAIRGSAGGFELLDGWQTHLTGLTAHEAGAILLSGLGGPGSDLGLGDAMASARLKLLAALPVAQQEDARRVSSRFHLDPVAWFRTGDRLDHLAAVAEAVWEAGRLEIRYETWNGPVERRVGALGLVLKAGVWYLVGSADEGPRTYRLSSILELTATGERFERPAGFDLAGYWAESTRRFEAGVYHGTAVLRITPGALSRLRDLSPAMARAAEQAVAVEEPGGWIRLVIAIESTEIAARQLLALGPDAVVQTPVALRQRICGLAASVLGA